MWVLEEEVGGRRLTDIINTEHENVKYLPGHKLPPNVVSAAWLPAGSPRGRDDGWALGRGQELWGLLELQGVKAGDVPGSVTPSH